MSDNWSSWPEDDQAGIPARDSQIPVEPIEAAIANEREGLPRNFRMRADRHYIDQLTAPSAGQPVRMLAVDHIAANPVDVDVHALVDSIRRHGIVHPLMVRRTDAGYALIAGRKRLAAARALRLVTVPCLVHEVGDTDAAALETADNLTVRPGSGGAERHEPSAGLRLIEQHLSKIRRYADVIADGSSGFGRSTFDILQAHTWRATVLADALALIAGTPFPGHRERSLRGIVDALIERFDCECRLAGIAIRGEVRDDLSSSGLNDRELTAGIGGALVATLPLVAQAIRPTVVVHVTNTESGGVLFDVKQSDAPVSRHLVADFFDDDPATVRPGGYEAAIGALAAKALAERHGGTAVCDGVNGGSRITLTVMRRS